jgi:uncharacterized membrane protein YbhN (UPF0104 family)
MKPFIHAVRILLIVAILAAAVFMLRRQLADYTWAELVEDFAEIEPHRVVLAIVLMFLNYVVLYGYDLLAIRYIGRRVPLKKLALASFVGHVASFNFGSLFGGASLRYRFYSLWKFSTGEIVQLIAILGVTFWLGVLALAGTVFLVAPFDVPQWAQDHISWTKIRYLIGWTLHVFAALWIVSQAWQKKLPKLRSVESLVLAITIGAGLLIVLPTSIVPNPKWADQPLRDLQPLGAVLLAIVIGYLAICFFRRRPIHFLGMQVPLPPPQLSAAQILVACADLMIAALVFYTIIPPSEHVTYIDFLGVFLLGMVVAAFTHVPAGVGVFEWVMLVFFKPDEIVAPVLVFRAVYYLLPLLIASTLMVIHEIAVRREALGRLFGRRKSRKPEEGANDSAPQPRSGE